MTDNWEIRKLGEVLSLEYGKPLSKEERNPNGLYPVYGANGIKNRTDKYYVDIDSIIIGRKGSAGEINYAKKKFWPLDVTYFTKFNQKLYDIDFIFYLLTFLELPRLAKGVKPGINRNDVYAIPVNIPPLPEQKRIVAILDKAFSAIDKAKQNAEANLKNAKEVFESYLNNIFGNKGADWEEKKLGEVCEIVNGGTPKTKIEEYWNGKIEWITPKDLGKLTDRYVFETPRKISALGLQKSSAKVLPLNSVILSTRAPIGHLAINKTEMATNQGCRGLIPTDIIYTDYLYYFLKNSIEFLNKLGTGATFKELSKNVLAIVQIPLPQLKEQKQIVQKLDTLSNKTKKLEVIYQQKIDNLEELKKSFLQKAFRGEL